MARRLELTDGGGDTLLINTYTDGGRLIAGFGIRPKNGEEGDVHVYLSPKQTRKLRKALRRAERKWAEAL